MAIRSQPAATSLPIVRSAYSNIALETPLSYNANAPILCSNYAIPEDSTMKSRFTPLCVLFIITTATFASVLDQKLSQTEKTVVPAAEAMPEEKLASLPLRASSKECGRLG